MKYISRTLENQILRAVKGFPALVLTGPRRAGKTWMLNCTISAMSKDLKWISCCPDGAAH